MPDLTDRLARLSPARRKLLELRMRKEKLDLEKLAEHAATAPSSEGGTPAPIPRRDDDTPALLSPDQERLYFVSHLHPDAAFYNIFNVDRFRGSINVARMRAALAGVVRRHEGLRTRFVDAAELGLHGPPRQVVEAPFVPELPVIELGHLPAEVARREVVTHGTGLLRRGFALDRLPLFRAAVFQLPGNEILWPMSFHHIAVDWTSVLFLRREAAALYADGARADLPELRVQPVDAAAWQRRRLEGDVLGPQITAWQERLEGAPSATELPMDRPRPKVQSGRGGRRSHDIPEPISDGLRALARSSGATLFMAHLAAFQSLVLRLSGQARLILGTPLVSRPHPDLQPLIGYFLYHLPIDTDLGGDPSFREALARTRDAALFAFKNQDVPFEKLVEMVTAERDLSRPPLTQLTLLFLNPLEVAQPDLPELEALDALTLIDDESAKFDFTLHVWDQPAFAGLAEYDSTLFDATTVERILRAWTRLMAAAMDAPDTPLSQLPLLDAAERHQVVVEWSDTAAVLPEAEHGLAERVEARASAAPDAVALVAPQGTLTYGGLVERAHGLAVILRDTGLGRGELVGLCVERSVGMVVATLAILRAGGAYLPLDADYPEERLRFLLEDSAAGVLLVQRHLLDTLRPAVSPKTRLLVLSEEGEVEEEGVVQEEGAKQEGSEKEGAPVELPFLATAADPAYVVYTSGSTGRPKGVVIAQHGVARLVLESNWLRFGSGEVIAQLAPFSFDASVLEMWGALLNGGQLVLAAPGRLEVGALGELLARHRVSLIFLTTSFFNEVAEATPEIFAGLRDLATGGDVIRPAAAARGCDALPPGGRLMNVYGPTENSAISTAFILPPPGTPDTATRTSLPIGRPIRNSGTRLLDERLHTAAIGAPGEIALAGDGLARGYLRRPSLTAERFVPDPVAGGCDTLPGARLYRTGDRGRWRADGTIDFLGRLDQQVKVRGFRVEPGEIETVLGAHPALAEVAVVALPVEAGGHRLVAWVEPTSDATAADLETTDPGALRAWLAERLPTFMIPTVWGRLERLPRNPAGKVDRAALRRRPAPDLPTASEAVAPRNALERTLAEIWCSVLGREEIGVRDDFFALGGDSILSIQIVNQTQRAGLALTTQQIFEHPTVESLAVALAAASAEGSATAGVAALEDAAPEVGEMPIVPIQRHFLGLGLEEPGHWNMGVTLAPGPGLGGLGAFEAARAVEALGDRHDGFRLRLEAAPEVPGGWRQFFAEPETPGASPALPCAVVELGRLPAERRDAAVAAVADPVHASLSLVDGPLGRGVCFAVNGETERILFSLHHWVVDGVSWRILLADLGVACTGRPPGPRGVSPRRWAQGWKERARHFDPQRWQRLAARLEDAPELAGLPFDPPTGKDRVADKETVESRLDADETDTFLRFGSGGGRGDGSGGESGDGRASVVDVLLAALGTALAGWRDVPATLVGVESHGREAAEGVLDLSRSVGWFTALTPVLLEIDPAAPPSERLAEARRQLGPVKERDALGWLRELALERASDNAPSSVDLPGVDLPQLPDLPISFNYLGQLDAVGGAKPGDAPFEMLATPGSLRAPGDRRAFALEIDAAVLGGRLGFAWGFDGRLRRASVEDLAARFLAALRELLAACAPEMASAEGSGKLATELPEIVQLPADVEPPLSFAQERMWLLDRIDPGHTALDMIFSMRLHGELDAGALGAAFDAVLARHQNLRASFPEIEGQPRVVISAEGHVAKRLVDLGRLDEDDRARALLEVQRVKAALPYDLAEDVLLRAWVVRLEARLHVLLLDTHHIISDGWSVLRLVDEVTALYRAAVTGEPAAVPKLAVQYGDFAAWQRHRLDAAGLRSELDWWREQLTDAPALLDLPLDRPRPPVQTYHGRTHEVELAGPLAAAVEALARRGSATLFMTLLAAFKILLWRLSGQPRIVVGTPIAGRLRPELEPLIGCFLNHLALVSELGDGPSFEALLGRLRSVTLGAFGHQEVPFERLLQELQPERDLRHTPIFQVYFNYINLPPARAEMPGLVAEVEGQPDAEAHFDITVYVHRLPDGFLLRWSYNGDLFDTSRIEEMSRQYVGVLEQVTARPEIPITEISLLTPSARRLLPSPEAPLGRTWRGSVPELVARHAAATPDAVAAIDRDNVLTYQALLVLARRLAEELRRGADGASTGRKGTDGDRTRGQHGTGAVRKGDVVAILAERRVSLAWALLGVLESGAAFVLLDPAYPSAHHAEILRQVRPRVFLELERREQAMAPEIHQALGQARRLVVPQRSVWRRWLGEDPTRDASSSSASPDDLAYVAFTSGSTGVPKGIRGRHGSLTHFTPWMSETYALGPADRFSMLSGLAHDPLHRDIFTPLQVGACVVAPPQSEILRAGFLARWMRAERITVANLTPAMAQVATEPASAVGSRDTAGSGDAAASGNTSTSGNADEQAIILPALRLAFLVGDALTRRDVARLGGLAPGVECVNHYGSTETQRAVGYHRCRPDTLDGKAAWASQVLPLGRGIPGVQLLVLRPEGQLAGVGEIGEIAVRSPHVALGYLDPEETAKRFVVNPKTGEDWDILYQTGDLGRYRPDGEVEHVGRADLQVKIRGFRIEVGEIEAALNALPEVAEAAVVLRHDTQHDAEGRGGALMACVVPNKGALSKGPHKDAELGVGELRAALTERLPHYMVPQSFRSLDSLPLTPNGKLDRAALRALPALERPAASAAPPEGELQRKLVKLWCEVLGLESVGIDDNFFDLGGHSLLLVRLHGRLETLLERSVPLMELFQHPNVRSLASHLEGHGTRKDLSKARGLGERQRRAMRRRPPRLGPRRRR